MPINRLNYGIENLILGYDKQTFAVWDDYKPVKKGA
jgi:hypothetical protein